MDELASQAKLYSDRPNSSSFTHTSPHPQPYPTHTTPLEGCGGGSAEERDRRRPEAERTGRHAPRKILFGQSRQSTPARPSLINLM